MVRQHRPAETFLNGNSRFKHLLAPMGRNRFKLSDTLSEQQKETLAKYDDAVNEMHSITEQAAFQCGFSPGVRLILEGMSII